MTKLAREGDPGITEIPVVGIGTTQTITEVGTGGTVWFLAVGKPSSGLDASSGNRLALAPDTGYHVKVAPGDFVAAYDGSAGGVISNAVGEDTTVVYAYYDSTAGTVYVTECA